MHRVGTLLMRATPVAVSSHDLLVGVSKDHHGDRTTGSPPRNDGAGEGQAGGMGGSCRPPGRVGGGRPPTPPEDFGAISGGAPDEGRASEGEGSAGRPDARPPISQAGRQAGSVAPAVAALTGFRDRLLTAIHNYDDFEATRATYDHATATDRQNLERGRLWWRIYDDVVRAVKDEAAVQDRRAGVRSPKPGVMVDGRLWIVERGGVLVVYVVPVWMDCRANG